MNDPHRPRYHFVSGNWMNDPKPFYWSGEYHIFFQYHPGGAVEGDKHWGHAISPDLLRWQTLPVALAPTPQSPDARGCWTGCVVRGERQFHVLYTGVDNFHPLHQQQCLASSDDLIRWEKFAGNPVLATPPAGFGDCFRDPQAWREGGEWLCAIGSEQPAGRGGAVLLYRSDDLRCWEYLHPLFLADRQTGHDCECPDFFPLGSHHVLLTSRGRVWWHLGEYRNRRFARKQFGACDEPLFYAAKTLLDGQGRRLLFGWIRESRPVEEQKRAGWSGALSLPRLLSLRPDGSLGFAPAPELESLRGPRQRFGAQRLRGTCWLDGAQGDALELRVKFAASSAKRYGVSVRCSPDLAVRADICGGSELRVFVDRSIIEAFVDGRTCRTIRIYPDRDDARGVALFADEGEAVVESVDLWEMNVPH